MVALLRRGRLPAIHSYRVYLRIIRPVCRESLVIVCRLRCRVKTFFFSSDFVQLCIYYIIIIYYYINAFIGYSVLR